MLPIHLKIEVLQKTGGVTAPGKTVASGSDLWLRSATVLEHGEHRRPQSATRSRLGQVPSDRFGVLHHELHFGRAIVFIRIEPEGDPAAFAQGIGMAEPDGVEAHAVLFQQQFQMALF